MTPSAGLRPQGLIVEQARERRLAPGNWTLQACRGFTLAHERSHNTPQARQIRTAMSADKRSRTSSERTPGPHTGRKQAESR